MLEFETVPSAAAAPVRHPCVETPARFALRCNGHYLWGSRNGTLVAKRTRPERAEWRIEALPPREEVANDAIAIVNHAFGDSIAVVTAKNVAAPDGFVRMPLCVKSQSERREMTDKAENNDNDSKDEEEQVEFSSDSDKQAAAETLLDDEGESCVDAVTDTRTTVGVDVDAEDTGWKLVRCDAGVRIQSSGTGEDLGITEEGRIILTTSGTFNDTTVDANQRQWVWEIEGITGELCFMSNPALDVRIRCDMAGLVTLSTNWKGWEVMRFVEWEDGYVKISSWMHQGWLLCSDADGTVTACSHAEFQHPEKDDQNRAGASRQCAIWAIEKYHGGGGHDGVVVRSKTHGRFLGICGGVLATCDGCPAGANAVLTKEDRATQRRGGSAASEWWKNSLTQLQIQHRHSSIRNPGDFLRASFTRSEREEQQAINASVAEKLKHTETIVWQLEAAHRQTYYFLSRCHGSEHDGSSSEKDETVSSSALRSIGDFKVTENIRTSDKIRLVRTDADTTKLYLIEQKQYFTCASNGKICLTDSMEDGGTDWIVETIGKAPQNGSVFRSRTHGLFLSYKDVNTIETEGRTDSPSSSSSNIRPRPQSMKSPGQFFGELLHRNKSVSELYGSQSFKSRTCVWTLEPCTPRAVSSEKLKVFAIGTSVAVGTTIAMPFALAGVAAVMGAVGAEAGIGFGIVAAGLTGAEAVASVGAIGATAYLCFRPSANSLSSEANNTTEVKKSPRSKRPFSNWRNW